MIAESVVKTLHDLGNTNIEIVYLYDESTIIGMQFTQNGQSNLYYYLRNLLVDVIGIYDTNGNLKVRYIYDAWGRRAKTIEYCFCEGETAQSKELKEEAGD